MANTYEKKDEKIDNKTKCSFNDLGIVHFGERLKEAMRGESNISFAKKCGLSDTVIGKYLRGESYPGIDKLPAISQACGKSIEWLLTGENAHTENRGIKKNSEIIEWWQIIFKSLNEDEIEKVIETFKNGGKSALFSPTVRSTEDYKEISGSSHRLPQGHETETLNTDQQSRKVAS